MSVAARALVGLVLLAVAAEAAEPTPPPHPGKVTYVDGRTQQVIEVEDVADVPETMRFAETPHGLVPVVKVVVLQGEGRSEIHEYGPTGELLRSTVGVRK